MSDPMESPAPSSTVLAANRTHRPDPLSGFNMYTGGWNITSMHYLASAGYTGIPGFAIGLLWVILGFGLLIIAGCMLVCCPHNMRPVPDFGNFGNYMTLGLIVIFTMATICGCGSLFTAQEALHVELSTTLTYLMSQVAASATATVDSLPPAAAPQAAKTAAAVVEATNTTSDSIHADLDAIRLWLIILTVTMVLLALIGLVFVACHIRPIINILVTIGWLLVMGTWILFGVSLLVEAVIGDTCLAINEWVENPRAGTALDIIMQCKQDSTSSASPAQKEEDDQTKFEQHKFLDNIDQQSHDQSSYALWIRKPTQTQSTSSPNTDSCSQMRSLFVPIFEKILTSDCPGMRKNSTWVRLALGVLSSGSMTSICLWIVYTRRSTMRLTKVQGSPSPLPLHFQDSEKKNEAGSSSAYHSAGPSTPN